ncbi:MAG TPA: hypothetical protein PLU53_09370 [Bacteroidia bacterium]|nr:hypothetical protein [Bacteroidia bacterium]
MKKVVVFLLFYPTLFLFGQGNGTKYQTGEKKFKLKDYAGAIADLTEWIGDYEIYKNPDPKAFYMRGVSKLMLHDYRGAIRDLDKAISNDRYNLSISTSFPNGSQYYYRGVAKIKTGDNNGGCADLSTAGELGDSQAYEIIAKHCN